MSLNTIAEQWEHFEREVVPVDADEHQRRALRIAFYGGAWGTISLLADMADNEVSEAAGSAMIDTWVDECKAFSAAQANR